jgi:hypothetical protein
MTVPNRNFTILDGGNGVSVTSSVVRALIGTASTGSVDAPSSHTSPDEIAEIYGYGPLVDAAQYELENSGGTIICVRTEDTVAGTVTEGKHDQASTSTGDCNASGTPNNKYRVCVEILSTGMGTVATFRYSLDAGPDDPDDEYKTWSLPITVPDTSGAGTYEIPNTGITLTFADAGSPAATDFTDGDKFYWSTSAPGYALADLQDSLDAVQTYIATLGANAKCEWVEVVGEVTAAIAIGAYGKMATQEAAKQFRFVICQAADVDSITSVTKLDSGDIDVSVAGIPQGSYSVVIAITTLGALGTMAFTYSLDGGKTTSSPVTSEVGGLYTIPGTGLQLTFSAGSYTTSMGYSFQTMDNATNRAAWQTDLISAYSSAKSTRLVVCAGFGEAIHPDGKIRRTPLAWGASSLLAKVSMSTDIGQIQDAGPLPGFINISHNEELNPGLDDAGFLTARTWTGYGGVYINQPRVMCPVGSDYDLIQYRRVMDEACRILDRELVLTLNRKIRVDSVTGFIDERDAVSLDQRFTTQVGYAVVTPGHAGSVEVRVRRNENLLSTRLATVDMAIIGMAYLKTLNANVGYKNPALVTV